MFEAHSASLQQIEMITLHNEELRQLKGSPIPLLLNASISSMQDILVKKPNSKLQKNQTNNPMKEKFQKSINALTVSGIKIFTKETKTAPKYQDPKSYRLREVIPQPVRAAQPPSSNSSPVTNQHIQSIRPVPTGQGNPSPSSQIGGGRRKTEDQGAVITLMPKSLRNLCRKKSKKKKKKGQ